MKKDKIFDFSRKGFQDIINIMTKKINECVDIANDIFPRLDEYISKVDWDNIDIINQIKDKLKKINERFDDYATIEQLGNYATIEQLGNYATIEQLGKTNEQLDNKANKDDVARISSGTPLFASDTSNMTDITKNYVNTTDGYLYVYGNGEWTKTDVKYQSTGLEDGQVTPIKTSFFDISYNMFNNKTILRNKIINSAGEIVDNTSYICTDFIEVDNSIPIYMTNVKHNLTHGFNNIAEYDENKTFIRRSTLSTTISRFRDFKPNTKYVRFNAEIKYFDGFDLMVNQHGDELLPFQEYGNFIKSEYIKNQINEDDVNTLIDAKLENQINEDDVNTLIDAKLENQINEDDVNTLIDAKLNNHYIINSTIPSISYNAKDDVLLRSTLDGTTHLDIYSDFDTLMTEHSDYISKTVLGVDSSGTRNINMYRLTPPQFSATYPKLPKVIIEFCIHGSEKPALLAMLNIVNNLCKNYYDNEILKFIRHNLDIILIPVVNPSGYDKHGRTNFNKVDLNRNFDYKWDESTSAEKGSAVASEIETQYIMNILNNNKDAIYFLDFHTYGSSEQLWSKKTKLEVSDNFDKEEWTKVGSFALKNCTSNAQKYYGVDKQSGYLGQMGLVNTNNPTGINYARSKVGIPSCSPEACYKFLNGELYTDEVNRFNIEFVINVIMESLRVFI